MEAARAVYVERVHEEARGARGEERGGEVAKRGRDGRVRVLEGAAHGGKEVEDARRVSRVAHRPWRGAGKRARQERGGIAGLVSSPLARWRTLRQAGETQAS